MYYRMTMGTTEKATAVLTLRIDTDLSRSLEREARRRRKTKSEVAREILATGLGIQEENPLAEEARRQSLLVSRRRSERETLEFIEQTADTRGWR
ncbi:MAG TPA: antitoxin MazE-like protein [Thermoanaerobaculia bacterium]